MPRPPLHVLFVARWYPSHDQPGRGSFVADLVRALAASGRAEITVASFDPSHVRGVVGSRPERAGAAEELLAPALGLPSSTRLPSGWAAPGVPVARLPAFLDGDRRRPADVVDAHLAPLRAFARGLAARWPVDVIHAHTGLPDGVAAAVVAEELDVPLLVTEHASTTADDLVDEGAKALYRTLLEPSRRLVAVSHALAREIGRALGVPETAIPVLPNAVPVDAFPVGLLSGRDPDELLYIGNRKASKGIETLLRAFAEAHADRPGLRLRLIGSAGPPADEARWPDLADELGVAPAVSFEGPAARGDVAAAMRHASVFVHASPRETFGMVAAEALASGLPVAATPSGGVDEIVGRDGRFGAIAASNSPSALADAIGRTLAAAPRMDRAGMRAHVELRYGAAAVASRTVDAYEGLLRAHRPAPRRAVESGGGAGPTARGGLGSPSSLIPPLVLALARGNGVERVALLPQRLRELLTIVTSPRGRYADDRDLPAWGNWLEFDPERFYLEALASLEQAPQARGGLGRLTAALGGGNNLEKRRRDLTARRDEIRRDGTTRFFGDVLRGLGGGDEPVWIVALDADDVLLADRIRGASGRLAPGGLRWLADLWDESGRIW